MHNPESVLEKETHELHWDFEIQTDHQISARRPDLVIVCQEKIPWRIVDFAVPADHRVKLKESEKKDKYLIIEKKCIIKVTFIPIVVGALGTVTKGLVQGLKN